MLSGDDATIRAVRELSGLVNDGRQIVIWSGAGVSANAGLPSWARLAESMHHEFKRVEKGYRSAAHTVAITNYDFPKFFSYCKSLNPQRYRAHLVKALS